MQVRNALATLAALAVFMPLHAQEPRPAATPLYKVEINFHDGNDAGASADRRYSFLVTDSRKATFKVGSRNPAVTGLLPQKAGAAVPTASFTYLDVGVNIDCFVQGTGSHVSLRGSLDLSNISGDVSLVSGVRNPVIRQTKLDLDAVMDLGKALQLASIDDPLTGHKLQVEATVTRAN